MTTETLEQYLARGGTITRCPPGPVPDRDQTVRVSGYGTVLYAIPVTGPIGWTTSDVPWKPVTGCHWRSQARQRDD